MREIKFRAWDTKEKKWVSTNIVLDYSGLKLWTFGETNTIIDDPDRYIIQQFTGLKDKNGKEIYEGDIVKVDDREIGAKQIFIGEVYYCTDYTLGIYPGFAGWSKRGHFELSPSIEVIGNIYENPELL